MQTWNNLQSLGRVLPLFVIGKNHNVGFIQLYLDFKKLQCFLQVHRYIQPNLH